MAGLATAIRGYLTRMAAAGIDNDHTKAVEAELHKFEEWIAENPSKVKQPDHRVRGDPVRPRVGACDG
jgi:hypothetical protein